MKLAFSTDWHLNFLHYRKVIMFLESLNDIDVDGIVVSGDIAEGDSLESWLVTINDVVNKPVYFVHGNHDFYRSSYNELRSTTGSVVSNLPNVHWLESKTIQLSSKTSLFGCDGWYDGNNGNYNSGVQLLDFDLVHDLKYKNSKEIKKVIEYFANVGADHIRAELPRIFSDKDFAIFVTHAPPFKELSYYMSIPTSGSFLPFFSSKIIGDALIEVAREYPKKELLVLCGHTHDPAEFKFENITGVCGGARYGEPSIFSIIDVF